MRTTTMAASAHPLRKEREEGWGTRDKADAANGKAGPAPTTTDFGKYRKGVVFKLARPKERKWKETVLHAFKGGSDGDLSYGTLTFDKAGNLYGTTYLGGDPSCFPPHGCGTVFKLTRGAKGIWKETILHRFNGSDGFGPGFVKLVFDASGNLY